MFEVLIFMFSTAKDKNVTMELLYNTAKKSVFCKWYQLEFWTVSLLQFFFIADNISIFGANEYMAEKKV